MHRGLEWLSISLLLLILVALGIIVVPANYGALWGNPSFSDWITPIANQLNGRLRLYESGLHSPLPPLPFVLMRLLHPRGAVWLDASLLNYLFQAALIILLFLAFARRLGNGVAFGAALAVLPVYFGMPKTMLYDSMAQFLITASGVAALRLVETDLDEQGRASHLPRWLALGALGLLLALVLLTKQNCGIGALLGAGLTLLFLPRSASMIRRGANILLLLLSVCVFFCLTAWALSPWVSFSGMIQDVFVTGSDPKGGGVHLVRTLAVFFGQMGIMVGAVYLLLAIFNACSGAGFPSWAALTAWMSPETRSAAAGISMAGEVKSMGAALFGSVLGLGLALNWARSGIDFGHTLLGNACGTLVLNLGNGLVILIAAGVMFPTLAAHGGDLGRHPLAPCALIFIFGALFHHLSTSSLHWLDANNPLLFFALALVLAGCAVSGGANRKSGPVVLPPVLGAFIIFSLWPFAHGVTREVLRCSESWPEIRQLAGARMRPQSSDLRTLVQTVDALAAPDDAVLLLPDDPNVEAWFGRRRPDLSSAIIFADQYWDRFVDQDFAQLQAHPPKVIIIGPRNFWRPFSEFWHPHRGAERLIDLVQEKLLPQVYSLHEAHAITYQDATDFMDVYVCRGP